MERSASHWITVEKSEIKAGDLVSAEAGGLPIYRVLGLWDQRVWLRDDRTDRDHILPLNTLHWKLTD